MNRQFSFLFSLKRNRFPFCLVAGKTRAKELVVKPGNDIKCAFCLRVIHNVNVLKGLFVLLKTMSSNTAIQQWQTTFLHFILFLFIYCSLLLSSVKVLIFFFWRKWRTFLPFNKYVARASRDALNYWEESCRKLQKFSLVFFFSLLRVT